MNLVNPSELTTSLSYIVNLVAQDNIRSTFIVKRAYKLEPGRISHPFIDDLVDLPCGEMDFPENTGKGVYYDSDFAPYKPAADILIQASAWAPNGSSTEFCTVESRIGSWTKKLLVSGDRGWLRNAGGYAPSKPVSFVSKKIDYGNSFGGTNYEYNPVGKGFFREGSRERELLTFPNVLLPGQIPVSPTDMIKPAGFGPIPYSWTSRYSKIGTYDDVWKEKHWPWFPIDFDWAFFNSAPADQQIPGYLRGDEQICFVNLHQSSAEYLSQLPCIKYKLFLEDRSDPCKPEFRKVGLNLDTLWIDIEQEKVCMVWRGLAKVSSHKLKEISNVYLCEENIGQPERELQEYARMMNQHIRDSEADAEEAKPVEFSSEVFDKKMLELDREFGLMESKFAELEKANEDDSASKQENVYADLIVETKKKPVNTSGVHEKRQTEIALQDDAEFNNLAKEMDESQREIDGVVAAMRAKRDWNRDKVLQFAEEKKALNGHNLSGLDLSLLNLDGLNVADCNLVECDLEGSIFYQCDFSGTNFTGANLTKATFLDCDLTNALFNEATIIGAQLTRCNAEAVEFAFIKLENTEFTEVKGKFSMFNDIDLSTASFKQCDFSAADFSGSVFNGTLFSNSILDGSNFSGSTLSEVKFADCSLANVTANSNTKFEKMKLKGLTVSDSQFEDCHMFEIQFINCDLDRIKFENCSLYRVIMNGSSVIDSDFNGTKLAHAKMLNSNYLRASFEHSFLDTIDFSDSNLYAANFMFAKYNKVNFSNANIELAYIKDVDT